MVGFSDILSSIPAVGNLLQGIGSIFDLTGGDSSKALSEQQLQGQQFLQSRMLKLAKAGQVNARGDVLAYDPKTNQWVVTPSATTKGLISAADAAQLAQLEHDVPLARIEQGRERDARGRASQAADAALAEYQHYNPMTADRLSADMYTQAAQGLKEGYGRVAGDVSTQALRAGTGGGQLLDQLARSYARDLGSARVNSRLTGLTTAGDINDTRRGGLLNRASMLRSMASGVPTVSANPDTLSAGLSAILSGQAGRAPGAIGAAAGISDSGYQNLIGQNTNYYQDLGMAGNDLVKGLYGIGNLFNTKDPSSSTYTSSIGGTPTGIPQAQRAGF